MSINLNILKCSAEGFSDLSDSDNLVAGCIETKGKFHNQENYKFSGPENKYVFLERNRRCLL